MFVLQMLPPRHNQQRCPFPALFSPYKETTKATAIGLLLFKLFPRPDLSLQTPEEGSARSGSISGPSGWERCGFGAVRAAVTRGKAQLIASPGKLSAQQKVCISGKRYR